MRQLSIAPGVALVLVLGCKATAHSAPSIPLPAFGTNVEQSPREGGGAERSFSVASQDDLERAREFYADWAQSHSWRQISASEESWSNDEWETFELEDGRQVRQRLIHWTDPQQRWSLRLALRTYGSGQHRAWVLLLPFANLDALPTDPRLAPQHLGSQPSNPDA